MATAPLPSAAILINAVSRSAALNPAETSANWPNLAPSESSATVPDLQGFWAVWSGMQYRLPCRRSRVRVPSAALSETPGDPGFFLAQHRLMRALSSGATKRRYPGVILQARRIFGIRS